MGKSLNREMLNKEGWKARGNLTVDKSIPNVSFYDLNTLCKSIENELDEFGMGVDFSSKENDIDQLSNQLQALHNYIKHLPSDMKGFLDQPLYTAFGKASGNMATIDMSKFQTNNSINLKGHYSIYNSGDGTKEELDYKLYALTFEDFIGGTAGEKSGDEFGTVTSKQVVEDFKVLFEEDYKKFLEGALIDGEEIELNTYLDSLILKESFHDKDAGSLAELAELIAQIIPITGIAEALTGKTLITKDKMTNDERVLSVVFAMGSLFAIGAAACSDDIVKAFGIEVFSEAAGSTVFVMTNEAGLSTRDSTLLAFASAVITGGISFSAMKKLDKIQYLKNLAKLSDSDLEVVIKRISKKELKEILGSSDDILKKRIKKITEGGSGTGFKFSEMTDEKIAKIAEEYRGKAPVKIPSNAKYKAQSKATGYEQITYKWNDGTYKYEVRWHTRTPGAPTEQVNTWVIQRTAPGSGGTKPATYILSGDRWVPRYEWQAAIDARQAGIATPEQIKILDKGHWKE